ncbi:flavin reductase family protein [Novosphingobium sp. MBES04]|uniref:flavin reductase family protein n=1 Tax=Novosphingobium sp. MBES04 TaxID=1206458 RepID=UPI00057DE724|nr:flavin reductase family protein [Novosphingobium sp. MBES04]GAM05010.1 flavin reductase domain-containing protein [Novosphingobium sp. MBES04]
MIEMQDFRTAMSRLGAAVSIITTDGPEGRFGMTASAVCSVSDEPASLLVCINRSARMNRYLKANGRFAVNVLTAAQEGHSRTFSDSALTMDQRFEGCGPWIETGGLPGLGEALAVLGCSVESVAEVGTHSVFFGTVEHLALGSEADGLAYFARRYHALPVAGAAA